ncbi:MAG TPA: orotidine-5'-phosphate decarboxylase [Fodinibius sp.]|nr:orotidine-5'-phosphate decarboxylase [Fodinibius sp.]
MDFRIKLAKAVQQHNSILCVGLDPNLDLLPDIIKNNRSANPKKVGQFLKTVIDVTKDHCTAYKPNLGFFEALGPDGWDLFAEILHYLPSDKIVIADAKRGDISSTAEHYAKAFFNKFAIDAITINPLMGFETLDPFLSNPEKAVYTLTLTSNPGASDILLQRLADGRTVASYIAQKLAQKQEESQSAIGMVVGATKATKLHSVIDHFPNAPLLIPGIGTQGGSTKALADALKNHKGIPLVNSSRSIIYAGSGNKNWEKDVAESAKKLNSQLASITEQYV